MGKKGLKLWTALTAALALAMVLWPVWGWLVHKEELESQVAALRRAVAALGPEELEHLQNLAKWYNYHLEQGTAGIENAYESILDLGEGKMALLEVPELGLHRPIYHGSGGTVGHDPATPLPIGGRDSHTVLLLSERLPWETGQIVYIECLGQRQIFRVEAVQTMPRHWGVDRSADRGRTLLTMVHDRGRTRMIIRCVRSTELSVRDLAEGNPLLPALTAAAAPFGVLIVAAFLRRWWLTSSGRGHFSIFPRKNREKSDLFRNNSCK